jgi:hypothetical protein
MVFGREVDISVGWTTFDSKGALAEATEVRLDEKVVDFLDQCNINKRRSFEMVITLPLKKKEIVTETDIFGLFWYMPFENDVEQRPVLPNSTTSDMECIIRCYWQNRLVPDSIVRNLPFFKEVEQRHRAEGISPKWRGRMIGIFFLDWQFDDISNNKLRFLKNLEVLIDTTEDMRYSPVTPCGPFIG